MRGSTLRRLAIQALSQIHKADELPVRVITPQTHLWTPTQIPVNSGHLVSTQRLPAGQRHFA
ncbi:TPA: hypothetical protein ACH3X1_011485 [Trebouxia sp. C0004]